MRARKRLRWAREEDPQGIVVYRAKRKREVAYLMPNADGGYVLVYQSNSCKRKTIVSTVNEGKDAAESFRYRSVLRRNPITPQRKTFLWGAGLGVATTALLTYFMSSTAAAKVLPPQNNPATQFTIDIGPGNSSTSYNGGTMFVALPAGSQGWVSINGQSFSSVPATQAIQLAASPVGTQVIVYTDQNGVTQTSNLTVTGPGA